VRHSDFLVIGGGVIGLSIAWSLLKGGARVTILDAGGARPPATAAAAGMLAPSFENNAGALQDDLHALSGSSLKMWETFAAELEDASGEDIDYQANGILGVACNETEAAVLEAEFVRLQSCGARVEQLTSTELLTLVPVLSPEVRAGIFALDDAQVDPPRLLAALKIAVERAGGIIRNGAMTTDLVMMDGCVIGVTLVDGTSVTASEVILASGATHLESIKTRVPFFPVKGEATALDNKSGMLGHVIRGRDVYLCPKADGRLVIGATEIPHDETLDVSEVSIKGLKTCAATLAPALSTLPEVGRWSGLRPGTPDGAPVLGRDARRPEGLIYALGHYRNGICGRYKSTKK